LDLEGRAILQDKGLIGIGPNGNGGLYLALRDNGIFEHL